MRITEARFFVAAAVLHLAIPVTAAVAPSPQYVGFFLAKSTSRRLEIDVDVSSAELPYQDPAFQSLPIGDPRRIARNDRRGDRRFAYVPNPDDPTDPRDDPSSDENAELVSPDSTADDYGRPPSREEIDGLAGIPGFGGRQVWQYPGGVPPDDRGPGAPTQTPKRSFDPDRGTKVLESGVRAKDSRLGLDFPGGAVIKSALTDSVRASDAPFVSSGSFVVSVSPQGRVTKVTLLSYNGGGNAVWQSIAKTAQARLASRTLPMKSSFSKGAMVSVSVRSDQKRPGGGTSREGTTLSFDVTDIDSKPVRVVVSSASATPIK